MYSREGACEDVYIWGHSVARRSAGRCSVNLNKRTHFHCCWARRNSGNGGNGGNDGKMIIIIIYYVGDGEMTSRGWTALWNAIFSTV